MTLPAVVAPVTAEWTKIRTTRAPLLALSLTAVLTSALALVSGQSIRHALDEDTGMVLPDFHPVQAGFDLVWYAQAGVVVFAVSLIGPEFTSRMVRLSVAAVPQRGGLLAAKAIAGLTTALPFVVVTVVMGYLLTQQGLGPHAAGTDAPGVLRGMVGGVLYLLLLMLIAFAVTVVVRSTVLALILLFVHLFVLSTVISSNEGLQTAARYLPDHAGFEVLRHGPGADPLLGPWAGLGVLALWTVLAVTVAWCVFRSRDV